MARDPHDALLLTPRQVTLVTQGTSLLDNMPSPYGASSEEEALFSDTGRDTDDALADVEAAAPVPTIVVEASKPSIPTWAWIAGGVALAMGLGLIGGRKR